MSRAAATNASSLLLCLALLATTGSAGRTWSPQKSPNPIDLPRMLDGRPDFHGVWSFATLTPLERLKEFAERAFLTDAEATEFVQRQLAVVNADGRARSDQSFARRWSVRCRAISVDLELVSAHGGENDSAAPRRADA